jgi:hypothetical protein
MPDPVSNFLWMTPDQFGENGLCQDSRPDPSSLFLPITVPEKRHKLRKYPTSCVYRHIYHGSSPCLNKGLVKLVTCRPKEYKNGSEKKTIASSMMQSTRREKPGRVKDPG